jgi:hypothetical protein
MDRMAKVSLNPGALRYEGKTFWLACWWHRFCTLHKGHDGDHLALVNPLFLSTEYGLFVRSAEGREDRTWSEARVRYQDIVYEVVQ